MKKTTLFSFLILCFAVINAYAGDDLESKLKDIQKQKDKNQKVQIGSSLRNEMYVYLQKNEEVSIKDFKKFRTAYFISNIVMEDLKERYNTQLQAYQQNLKDEKEKNAYRIAIKFNDKSYYKPFYACKGNDQGKVIESFKKVDEIRSKISAILQKDRSMDNSDQIIKLQEQILEECRFHNAAYWLLDAYRIRGQKESVYREKFNNLMLRIITDDQVNYDYLYTGIDGLNTRFIKQYLFFLTHINNFRDKPLLNKEQIRLIADNILTKHREVFDLNNPYYYSATREARDEINTRDGVQALVNLSTWLQEYKLNDLNNKLIDMFFNNNLYLETLQYDRNFKDFMLYLQQKKTERKDSNGQTAEEKKKTETKQP